MMCLILRNIRNIETNKKHGIKPSKKSFSLSWKCNMSSNLYRWMMPESLLFARWNPFFWKRKALYTLNRILFRDFMYGNEPSQKCWSVIFFSQANAQEKYPLGVTTHVRVTTLTTLTTYYFIENCISHIPWDAQFEGSPFFSIFFFFQKFAFKLGVQTVAILFKP